MFASFRILFNLSFINYPAIRWYIIWSTDNIVNKPENKEEREGYSSSHCPDLEVYICAHYDYRLDCRQSQKAVL